MKVLAIHASPRKNGNTERLLDRVIEGLQKENGTVEKISLIECPVQPITECPDDPDECGCSGQQNDYYSLLIQKFLESDCLILASPTYWYSVSAQLKAFIDRWSCSQRHIPEFMEQIRGKKVAVVTVHAEEDPTVTKYLFGQLKQTFQYLGLDFVGKVQGRGLDRGDVEDDTEAMNKAFKLGKAIASKKYFKIT